MLSGLIGLCDTRTLLRGVLLPEQAGLNLSKPGNSYIGNTKSLIYFRNFGLDHGKRGISFPFSSKDW